MTDTCPGCGAWLDRPDDCGTCEYFNLAAGRYHYCGQPDCHCRALRGTIRAAVLARFAQGFAAGNPGQTYREVAAERLGLQP